MLVLIGWPASSAPPGPPPPLPSHSRPRCHGRIDRGTRRGGGATSVDSIAKVPIVSGGRSPTSRQAAGPRCCVCQPAHHRGVIATGSSYPGPTEFSRPHHTVPARPYGVFRAAADTGGYRARPGWHHRRYRWCVRHSPGLNSSRHPLIQPAGPWRSYCCRQRQSTCCRWRCSRSRRRQCWHRQWPCCHRVTPIQPPPP